MSFFRLIAFVSLSLLALGCGGNKNRYLRKQAGQDLSCSEGQVHLSTVASGNYLAQACGRRAVYTYTREQGAVRISAIEGANVPGEPVVMPPPGQGETPPPPPPPPPPAP